MPATIGPVAQQQTAPLNGGYFVYTSATTVTLTISGFDGYCHVEVGNALSRRTVSFNANKTMNLTVNGPGGLHPTHFPEQAWTCYIIYLAWKSATATVNGTANLFAVPTGTTIDAAKLTALEAGYDYCSRPIGYVANNGASNITQFKHENDWWTFAALTILSEGKATVSTPISVAAIVPQEARRVLTYNGIIQEQVSLKNLTLLSNGKTIIFSVGGNTNGGNHAIGMLHTVDVLVAPATLFYYSWSVAPTRGFSLGVAAVQLGGCDREGP